MNKSYQKTQLKGILFACVTALFWGFLAIAIKVAIAYVPAETIVWFRFGIAFILLLAYHLVYRKDQLKILFNPPFLLFITAVGLSANYLGYALGVEYTSPNNAQVFIQAGPMILMMAGLLIFKEQLSIRQIGGYVLAGIGFYLFYSDQMEGNFSLDQADYLKGVLWTLFGAFCWSVYAITQKFLVQTYPAQQLNLFIFCFATIIYTPVSDFTFAYDSPLWLWALLIFLGLNTLIAYGCLGEALKYAEANKISIIITLNPIITFIAMGIFTTMEVTWIAPEIIDLKGISGAMLVLFGAVLVIWRKRQKGKAAH